MQRKIWKHCPLFKEINGDNVTFEVLSYHEFGKKKVGRVWMEIPHDQRCVRRSGTGKNSSVR